MILLKKKNIENYFLVGLSAIYLLKSVLHLKYEKITVINNMQLLHYIDTVPLFDCTGPVHRRVICHDTRDQVSTLNFLGNFQVS